MTIVVNGEKVSFNDALSVGQLLIEQDVKMPDMVSVELNGKIVKRGDFDSTLLAEDDKVEFLYFMGGGCGTN